MQRSYTVKDVHTNNTHGLRVEELLVAEWPSRLLSVTWAVLVCLCGDDALPDLAREPLLRYGCVLVRWWSLGTSVLWNYTTQDMILKLTKINLKKMDFLISPKETFWHLRINSESKLSDINISLYISIIAIMAKLCNVCLEQWNIMLWRHSINCSTERKRQAYQS